MSVQCTGSPPACCACRRSTTHTSDSGLTCCRRERGAAGPPCTLVVSDTSPPDAPHAVYLFRRWLPLTFAIRCAAPAASPAKSCCTLHTFGRRQVVLPAFRSKHPLAC